MLLASRMLLPGGALLEWVGKRSVIFIFRHPNYSKYAIFGLYAIKGYAYTDFKIYGFLFNLKRKP